MAIVIIIRSTLSVNRQSNGACLVPSHRHLLKHLCRLYWVRWIHKTGTYIYIYRDRLWPWFTVFLWILWLLQLWELLSGHRFRPLHDFGFVGLDILYTYPEDNGIYMCKATNKFGSDSTQTQLQCFGSPFLKSFMLAKLTFLSKKFFWL